MVRPAVAMHLPMPPVREEPYNFTKAADMYIKNNSYLFWDLFVLDNCEWCRNVLGKLDRNKCCANCGGPRE